MYKFNAGENFSKIKIYSKSKLSIFFTKEINFKKTLHFSRSKILVNFSQIHLLYTIQSPFVFIFLIKEFLHKRRFEREREMRRKKSCMK